MQRMPSQQDKFIDEIITLSRNVYILCLKFDRNQQ